MTTTRTTTTTTTRTTTVTTLMSTTPSLDLVDCNAFPAHSWCLKSFGTACSSFQIVENLDVMDEELKAYIVNLHNNAREQVSL